MSNRLISFDTETTGLYFEQGDRVVEIGAVEILGRNKTGKEYQTYINPEGREMSAKAAEITNIKDIQLTDKPLFKDIANEFIDFIAFYIQQPIFLILFLSKFRFLMVNHQANL